MHQDNTHRPMDLRAGTAGATGAPARSPTDWPLLAAASAIAAEARAAVKVRYMQRQTIVHSSAALLREQCCSAAQQPAAVDGRKRRRRRCVRRPRCGVM